MSPVRKAKKKTATKKAQSARKTVTDATDKHTISCIDSTARTLYTKIQKKGKPELQSPVRALSNVHFDPKVGYLEIGRSRKVRTLTVNTVKTFAQTLKMMHLSKSMIGEDTFATKREAYYVSKNWDEARFQEQTESDTVMDDIEAMFSLDGVSREQLRFYPEEHGGAVAGNLVVVDHDPISGQPIEIDCTKFGTGAYTIPHSVEHLQFKTKAKFVLAIETGGMFQRLQTHGFWDSANCIIVSMGGVPTRATRRFIRLLSESRKIPVYAFVDCDPYGISNIYRTLKVGSGNTAHLNKFFCVPNARFLGVTPQDIKDYELPTHPLLAVDVKRARDALKNDPFFRHSKPWQKAINQLVGMGVRAEQQALAKWGLNYVIEEYLPDKLAATKAFLPLMSDWSFEEFEAAGIALVRRLSGYVRSAAAGEGPVVRMRPVADIARELDLAGCLRRGTLTPESFEALAATYADNSTRLHHPGYLAHQVAVPDFPATLADLMNGTMNNGMAIYEMGPAAVAVELTVLDWMLGKLGWPASRWPGQEGAGPHGAGVLTHGGSLANLTALLAARARVAPDAWEDGVPGDLAVLAPPTSHYSVARATSIMGLGRQALFPLEVDEFDVIRPECLPAALAAVRAAGRRPLALVANACSTATGLFDSLEPIAAFCRDHRIWLHVDGCHGASSRLSAGEANRLDGVEHADSVVWDAHKMLRTSGLCAAVLFRDEKAFDRAFKQKASYLFYGRQDAGVDLIHRTVECTKMPLGLKLFLNLAWHGESTLGAYWDDRLAVTRRFAERLRAQPAFSCPYEPESNILCFRHGDGDDRQIAIRQKLLDSGDFYLSSAEIAGRRYLRVVVMSPSTNDAVLDRLLDAIEAVGAGL